VPKDKLLVHTSRKERCSQSTAIQEQEGPAVAPGQKFLGNLVLSLIFLAALEAIWCFYRSPQEEAGVNWAHLGLFLGASAVSMLQHPLVLGTKHRNCL